MIRQQTLQPVAAGSSQSYVVQGHKRWRLIAASCQLEIGAATARLNVQYIDPTTGSPQAVGVGPTNITALATAVIVTAAINLPGSTSFGTENFVNQSLPDMWWAKDMRVQLTPDSAAAVTVANGQLWIEFED